MGRAPTDTKEKLIETATELIFRDSYGAVSVDEICSTAGVHKGSFYHYFPSKADLALEAIEDRVRELQTEYDSIFSSENPPVRRFELLAQFVYEQQENIRKERGCVCGCPFATLGSELAAQDENIGKRISGMCAEKLSYYEETLRDLIKEGLLDKNTDVSTKAQDIHAFILGHLMVARINNNLEFIRDHLKDSLSALIGINENTKAIAA